MIEDIAPIHTVAYTQTIMSTVVIYVKQTSKLVFSHNTERHHFLFPVKNEQNQRKRLGKSEALCCSLSPSFLQAALLNKVVLQAKNTTIEDN